MFACSPGFVDVAVAIASGPAVAQGQSPIKVKLSNRLDRKRLSVVLDGEESLYEEEGGEVFNKEDIGHGNRGDNEIVQEDPSEMPSGPKRPSNLANPTTVVNLAPTTAVSFTSPSAVSNIPTSSVGVIPANLARTNHSSTNHSSLPFCTASQSLSVSRGSHNTEAMTVMMTSYGAMMGQMAKGMLEGVGPQLMSMLQNFQVHFLVK